MRELRRRTGPKLSQARAMPSLGQAHADSGAPRSRLMRAYPAISPLPLEMRWSRDDGPEPVPVRIVSPSRRRSESPLPSLFEPAYAALPPGDGPFNFSAQMKRLSNDVIARCPLYAGFDVERILFCVTRTRRQGKNGLLAKVTPMRCQDGALTHRRRGQVYQVQSYWVGEVNILYLMTFCLPRYMNQSFDEKMITVFHELHHISPAFDGDLRRHEGRYCFHTNNQKHLDQEMAGLVREYLATNPDPALFAFLRVTFDQLRARYGHICGAAVPVPKLVPIPAQPPAR